MSEFNGRRAPNFSQYLDDLNAIPSPYDQAVQQQQQDSYNFDAELSLFTNTEFFDFDQLGDLNLPNFDAMEDNTVKKETAQGINSDMDFLNLLGEGFGNVNDISSTMNSINAQSLPVQNAQFSAVPSLPNGPLNINPAPSQAASQPSPQSSAASSPSAAATPAPAPTTTVPASVPKRKNTQKTPVMSVEEAARIAAEEDKRRRNTAASARFRVKKKMREQALEKTVKETTDKNTALEARVTALELENQWLKNLITEKNGQTSEEAKKSENDIAAMFKKFLASQQQKDSERSSSESKIGVGTV
ncbi:bZIP transcription factor [Aspergillus sclerotiicarbonarius CBS 121057]|uniref:BZIP transcription factor n=1 Tax=Aspergillus sclerotiicarbonarius (strain CBS 121057 / IBT 28362) TaxID=1448318 RepID=A0A319EKX2_ASPSB|nr:bZIP transcription factor [Aspergillus sclerotiicarbonarius CBS 121057]